LKQGEWLFFLPHALVSGHYHGIRENGRLIAMAGTHMASSRYNIAALGTVFTHPGHRGRGLARICCSHVLNSISYVGIHRVVLNVEDEKVAARGIYDALDSKQLALTWTAECVRI
jgi:predicted GNAT family acetyltransferase